VDQIEHSSKRFIKRSSDTVFIVLSYNGCEDTVACLESLYACKVGGADVIVIDNNSTPPVDTILKKHFPGMDLITITENLGWAGGNNVGVKLALERGYKWICLLNNDTVFPEGQVSSWVDALSNLPPALVHPSVYYWDEPDVAQLREGFDINNQKLENMKEWNGCAVMTYAYGACLAIHREIFEKVGVFDERLFLQLEETDFYRRACKEGYVSVCAPFVKMFHKESKAFGGKITPGKTYYTLRNSLLLVEKNKGSVKEKLILLRGFYWALSNTRAKDGNIHGPKGLLGLAKWICSDSPYAVASRYGVLHYFTRRFGKMPADLSTRIGRVGVSVGKPIFEP
jgi:GT2 family glycosyltransferase